MAEIQTRPREARSTVLAPRGGRAGLKTLQWIREASLTVVALLGLVCIAAVVLGFAYKASFVVYRTGSMEPLHPVGALSLVVEVPAADVRPGDVVSVKRPGSNVLITHRVVSIAEGPGAEGAASLTLKGDANSSNDPLPYQVDTARRVLLTVPILGQWVMAARGPAFIGGAALLAGCLVAWAFWPARTPRHAAEM